MTISEALHWAEKQLQKSCERPRYEAELILAHSFQRDRLYLLAHEGDDIGDFHSFQSLIKRRAEDEPYEYIVGEASFYDLHLTVASGVLIPRPETELLVDRVSEVIEREGVKSLIEIGVGSGAISIVLARKFPNLQIVATDISGEALSIAQYNIERYGVGGQITLTESNLMDKVQGEAEMVVSNPPYIANDFALERNVVGYEPHTALFGGEKGDELLQEIVLETHKRGICWLACEMGYDQRETMQSLFNQIGVEYSDFYQDLAGLDRGFVLSFTGKK